jgi:dihydrodipicolinate synthase/N-acetylneuraminate lyase
MSQDFHGIYPMIYTFFDASGRIDRQAMKKQLDACVAGGVHGTQRRTVPTSWRGSST